MISETPKEFLIGIIAGSAALMAVLLARMLAQETLSRKFHFFLFFLLYSGSLLTLFAPNVPFALCAYQLALIGVGLLFFYGETVLNWFKTTATPSVLQELKRQRGPFHELVVACRLISEAKMGALLIIERKKKLSAWVPKGVRLDARISREILVSIFTPPGALHDGAVLMSRDLIHCAGLIVPLSKNPNLSKELGTRHRAAIGFSEITDALCLIISEETGAVSMADRGRLFYDIPQEKLSQVLEQAYRFKMNRAKSAALYTEPAKEILIPAGRN